MAFDYTNLYPDTSANGGYTKSWNYTTVTDSIATVAASGYFNKVATRLGIGDNIVVARVDAFDTKNRTTLVEFADLFVTGIAAGVVTTTNYTTAFNASPAFTGTPTTPTAAVDTNTTQIASTAFVLGQAASVAPVIDGVAAVGTSTRYARQDHVHPTDTSRAPLASPTLTGTPAAPTAAVDTNTTQLATTAFVVAQAAAATPLIDGTAAAGTSTRFARADHVHPTDTTRAALASPTFTGTPAAPTAAAGTNTTQLATTAGIVAERAATKTLTNTTLDSAGTGNVLQVSGVTISRGQYPGTATNDSATAGNEGEYISSTVLIGSAVSLTTSTAANVTSISLTAGDWDVWGNVAFNPAGTTTVTALVAWISTTSAATPTIPNNGSYVSMQLSWPTGTAQTIPAGSTRISLSGTTTVYLSTLAVFGISTMGAYGFIGARRRR